MLVNPGVAGFKNYAHETVAQILESLRAFTRYFHIHYRSNAAAAGGLPSVAG